jgi:dihydroorotase
MAQDYKRRLEVIDPSVTYLMSLYLHPDVTPATIAEAAKAGITNVKSYPAGVTTNSSAGVVDYEAFYPVFEAMQEHDMILNLHGEKPNSAGCHHEREITVMNAEEAFLPTLLDLHKRFPRLRIILEHCTTAAAIAAVKSCSDRVAATITAHHLYLTIDEVVGNCYNFCKPVAKNPEDRKALLAAAVSGDKKFFFGSDSAPHPVAAKEAKGKPAAGCFTQSYATQLVFDALEGAVNKGWLKEGDITEEKVAGFLSVYGREYYGVAQAKDKIVVSKKGETVEGVMKHEDVELAPFRAGEQTWSLEWKK